MNKTGGIEKKREVEDEKHLERFKEREKKMLLCSVSGLDLQSVKGLKAKVKHAHCSVLFARKRQEGISSHTLNAQHAPLPPAPIKLNSFFLFTSTP